MGFIVREPAAADESPERALIEGISRGDREAFAVFFDRTAPAVGAEVTARLGSSRQRIAILAATYVEVWWLSGCRSATAPDAMRWIARIVDRRIADAHRIAGRHAEAESGPGRSELELADLLGRPPDRLWPA